ITYEHILQHSLDPGRRSCVADEIGAELAFADGAERHIIAHDFQFVAALVQYARERIMCAGRLDRILQFDVRQLLAADNALLPLDRQRIPPRQIMQIFLHNHIAAAREAGVFTADDYRVVSRLADRVFRSVHKADEITVVEIFEAMGFIDDGDGRSDPGLYLGGKLETDIHRRRADVKKHI